MDWNTLIFDPLRLLLRQFGAVLPHVFSSVLMVLAGWAIAHLTRLLVVRTLHWFKVDRLSEKARLTPALERSGIRFSFVEVIGELAYWLILLVTIIAALQFIGVPAASAWLEQLGYFVPRLAVSIVILLLGMLLASFLAATIRTACLNAGLLHGRLLGQMMYVLVSAMTVIMALEQLRIVTRTFEVALYIMLASAGLAMALAVGLGGQELIRRLLDELWERWKSPPPS